MKRIRQFAAVAAAGLVAAPRLFAQGCAMCYATAQAQDARAARHLDYAILALLIPSVSLFAGVFIAALRRSMRDAEDELPLEAAEPRPARTPPAARRAFSPES
jgi:hypothetical protein